MPPKAVFDVARAAELHAGGMPLAQVARLPGFPAQGTLKRHLLAGGYEVWTGPWKMRGVTRNALYDLHHVQDMTTEAIGQMFNCSASAVRRRLVDLKIPKGSGKHRSMRGPSHWSWKGGRYTDGRGYVRVRCPGHPNAGRNGYVLEHRKVASEMLGRALLPHEEVHHVDGDKTNNSPENLAVVSRGKHQRLHADVCKELWALRKEVESLRASASQSPSGRPGVVPRCADWKVVG